SPVLKSRGIGVPDVVHRRPVFLLTGRPLCLAVHPRVDRRWYPDPLAVRVAAEPCPGRPTEDRPVLYLRVRRVELELDPDQLASGHRQRQGAKTGVRLRVLAQPLLAAHLLEDLPDVQQPLVEVDGLDRK